MKQVVPQRFKGKAKKKAKTPSVKPLHRRNHNFKYGTSKLEKDFAREFLDAYDIVYIYQYELKDMGSRYMDFAVSCYRDKSYLMEEKDGINCVRQDGQFFDVSFFIEIDGDYWHANPEKFDEKDLTPTQKHNLFVDRQKDQYAALRCIPLVRIWEHDIRNNKEKVLRELEKYINLGRRKKETKANMSRPH